MALACEKHQERKDALLLEKWCQIKLLAKVRNRSMWLNHPCRYSGSVGGVAASVALGALTLTSHRAPTPASLCHLPTGYRPRGITTHLQPTTHPPQPSPKFPNPNQHSPRPSKSSQFAIHHPPTPRWLAVCASGAWRRRLSSQMAPSRLPPPPAAHFKRSSHRLAPMSGHHLDKLTGTALPPLA